MTLKQIVEIANNDAYVLAKENGENMKENIEQVFIDMREDLADRIYTIIDTVKEEVRELNPFTKNIKPL